MPKAVPRNSRAIVVQLVTNIETGNEKGYGHLVAKMFPPSAFGPEFPLISSSNDGIMVPKISRLPLGRLSYCTCPTSLLGFLVAGIACTIACVGALFCCRILSVRRRLCMWRSLCCSTCNPSWFTHAPIMAIPTFAFVSQAFVFYPGPFQHCVFNTNLLLCCKNFSPSTRTQ